MHFWETSKLTHQEEQVSKALVGILNAPFNLCRHLIFFIPETPEQDFIDFNAYTFSIYFFFFTTFSFLPFYLFHHQSNGLYNENDKVFLHILVVITILAMCRQVPTMQIVWPLPYVHNLFNFIFSADQNLYIYVVD